MTFRGVAGVGAAVVAAGLMLAVILGWLNATGERHVVEAARAAGSTTLRESTEEVVHTVISRVDIGGGCTYLVLRDGYQVGGIVRILRCPQGVAMMR